MKPVDLAEKVYVSSISQRQEINSSLSTPLAAMALFSASAAVFGANYKYKFSGFSWVLDSLFVLAILIVVAILAYSIFRVFYIFKDQDYTYIQLTEKMRLFQKPDDTDGESESTLDGTDDHLLSSILDQALLSAYLACIKANEKINTRRSRARKEISTFILAASISFGLATTLFIVSKFLA